MKTPLIVFILALLLTASCKTVKKTQQIQEAITKKDTTQTVIISAKPSVDSGAIVRDILDKALHNKIDFNTFNAKIKVDYEGPEKSDSYTAYVSMKKDSIILIKIKGSFLGISAVGLEAKIRKDSVVVAQLVGQKSVTYRSIGYLQEVTQLPFDFYTLQDLIIGNPVFADSNLVSYKAGPTQLLVLLVGDIFKHLLTLDNNGYKVLHSKLDDVNTQRNRTGDITFGEYRPMGPFQFSTYRKISLAEKSKLDISLDFKEYGLNEPLKYNFDIPKNLKRL
ncbi:DUF4292 domain-containing protein [Sediminibacterium soli]|uniref:DUF4292 domain-containing protein n=1 Tax=Sediminibacterium soli TaxID=2698829 RepID=UPI00137AB8F5|nr:DUF4292 domain-containing protein [Sediminibacterium soli]NCI48042.1 DUF4292 domain-containing protein [Sediminibacterium soli]